MFLNKMFKKLKPLKPYLSKQHSRFKAWKPIHLCWWFEKHNLPIPPYLIGGVKASYQRYWIIGEQPGTPVSNPDNVTWGTENTSASKSIGTQFFVRISVSFIQDTAFPSWELYTAPFAKTWEYTQVRLVGA